MDLTQLGYAQITGDIGVFENHNLGKFNAFRTQISGDIGKCFKSSSSLYETRLYDTQISGDISVFANKSNLFYLKLNQTQVSGSVNSLVNLTKLIELIVNNT